MLQTLYKLRDHQVKQQNSMKERKSELIFL